MALFIPGGALGGGTISGKQGSIVFSRNRSGAYIRSRTVPVNPNTSYQQAARNRLSTLTSRWFNVLTATQREEWSTYAANVPRVNRIGLPINLLGLNWYIAMNTLRLQCALTITDDAPSDFVMATYTLPSVLSASEATQLFSLTFDNTDDWADDDGAMLLFGSRPQNVTKNFFKGPYRYMGRITGDTAVPPTSPNTETWPFSFVDGQKLFFKCQVCNPAGEIGTPAYFDLIAAA